MFIVNFPLLICEIIDYIYLNNWLWYFLKYDYICVFPTLKIFHGWFLHTFQMKNYCKYLLKNNVWAWVFALSFNMIAPHMKIIHKSYITLITLWSNVLCTTSFRSFFFFFSLKDFNKKQSLELNGILRVSRSSSKNYFILNKDFRI